MVLPWVHRVFANLKTWALGVYHGLRRQHLQSYLDEFVFRFNRRRTRHAAFRSILGIGVAIKPATYKIVDRTGATGISLCLLRLIPLHPVTQYEGATQLSVGERVVGRESALCLGLSRVAPLRA